MTIEFGVGGSLFDGPLILPALTVRLSALEHNIAELARFAADHRLLLAPHAKTTMAPGIFGRQLAAGAWGLTAASVNHVQVYRRFGVRRVLLANELVDPAAIAWIGAELGSDPDFEFHCYVDSVAGVRLLADGLAGQAPGRPVNVLVEVGFEGGRTGCRTAAQVFEVARAATGTGGVLAVTGVAGFEGGLGAERTEPVLAGVRDWSRGLVDLLGQLLAAGHVSGPGIVSAGGSAFPDLVAEAFAGRPAGSLGVLRSGSYVTHDDGLYAGLSPFDLRSALALWARVTSVPEPGLAVLDFGRRDAGFDHALPNPRTVRGSDRVVRAATGLTVTDLNDQHAYLRVDAGVTVEPGEIVELGVSHPCTTIDRWRHLLLLDDEDRVLEVLDTYF